MSQRQYQTGGRSRKLATMNEARNPDPTPPPKGDDPATQADIERLYRFVHDVSDRVRGDVLGELSDRRRELWRRVLYAFGACVVAALVIWAWLRLAWDHVSDVRRAL